MPDAPIQHFARTSGAYEPVLMYQLLPRCQQCHAPHPLARKPKRPADTCPDCGTSLPELGAAHEEPALLTGFWGGVARSCFSISNWLLKLERKLK